MTTAGMQPLSTPVGAEDLAHPPLRTDSPSQLQHEQLTRAAQRWVSQTFFGTLLKQMRDSPFKSDLFSGGRGGEAFASLYDQHLADRMARAAGRPLVASIVRHLQGRGNESAADPLNAPAGGMLPKPSAPNARTDVTPAR